jgi:hypothetical protein
MKNHLRLLSFPSSHSGPWAWPISSLPSPLPRVGWRPALGPARHSDNFTRPSPFFSLAGGTWRAASLSTPNIARHVTAALSAPVLSWPSQCWERPNVGCYLPCLRAVPSSALPHLCSPTAWQRPRRAAGTGFPPAP